MTTGTASLSNKLIFLLGVNTGFTTDGEPDARYVDFYRQRSSPNLHCAIVGNVVVPGGHGSNQSTPTISFNGIWAILASAIKTRGSVPGVQLATAWDGYVGARKFLSTESAQVITQARKLVRSLDRSEVDIVLKCFRRGSEIAVEHGFGHIQIHAAHGYLLSLLIDKKISPHAGRVGDGLGELAEWLRSRSVESSIRISMRTGDPEFDAQDGEALADSVSQLPFDFIDLSSGFYNIDKRLIYPARPDITAVRFHESIVTARRHPLRRFIVSGRVAQRAFELPSNAHIGLCRDLIANPRFLVEPENGCRNYGKCHYYSRGGEHITCPQWNETS